MVSKPVFRQRREQAIQDKIIPFLEKRGWLVERLIGVATQFGLPDLLCYHPKHGLRMIDIKVPKGGTLTQRQCQKWPAWEGFDLGVWIMVAPTEEEYAKLFEPANFRDWWRPSYDKYVREKDEIIAELLDK